MSPLGDLFGKNRGYHNMTDVTKKKIIKWFWILFSVPVVFAAGFISLVWAFAEMEQSKATIKIVHQRFKEDFPGHSVLKICLPVQRTQVQSLIRKYSTCRRVTNPMSSNY